MTEDDTASVVMRHAVEDWEERELQKRAAPLAAGLDFGINYFEPKQYNDLVYFFLEGKAINEALECGQFSVEKYVKVARVREGCLLTISELARITNVPQRTLWDLAAKARLPFRRIGNKKLYNINNITAILADRRDGT